MRILFFVIVICMYATIALSQTCLPNTTIFNLQAHIDDFQSNNPGCTEIIGSLQLIGSDITNLNGLSTITSIGGNLQIETTSLTSLQGLDNLQTIGGYLHVRFTSISNFTGLGTLGSIGWFNVRANNSLTDFDGISSLTSIADLAVFDNSQLLSLDGLENVTTIQTINFQDNGSLVDLAGVQDATISEDVILLDNISLGICHIESICDFIDLMPGESNIQGNAIGCQTEQEIIMGCNCIEPDITNPGNQTACDEYILPLITGSNLTGNEAYYDDSQANGGMQISGLIVSTQTVYIYDGVSGCEDEEMFIVTINPLPTAGCMVTHESCAGNADGSITASGGVDYDWDTGDMGATISNLIPGTYTVTVTDANGCTDTCSETVLAGSPLPTAGCMVTHESCAGNADGSITASGGLDYDWDTGDMGATISNLIPGTYTVTVTDANGCTDTCSETVLAGSPLPTPGCMVTHESCVGNADGSITASGGVDYDWDTGDMGATISNLIPGTYTVTVTDANGCTDTCSETVVAGSPLPTVGCLVTHESCVGNADGSITASGGVDYDWDTGDMGATISNLIPGTYTVTVTDANGCTATCSETVLVGNPLPTVNCDVTPETCDGASDGTITASGGVSYLWSTNDTGPTISNLTPGTYSVTVTDVNGCTGTCEEIVGEGPDPIEVEFDITSEYCMGDQVDELPTESNNDIVGFWQPSSIDNTQSLTYVFFPLSGQCAQQYELEVTIDDCGMFSDTTTYITKWKTDNPGMSDDWTIRIPTTTADYNYNYDVDWESDGIWDDIGLTGDGVHTYPEPGEYIVSIRGDFPLQNFDAGITNTFDRSKLIDVLQWGDIEWKDMRHMFNTCDSMFLISATDIPNLTFVQNMEYMFFGCSFTADISSWDISNVENTAFMFSWTNNFNSDLSNWDVSQVTNMTSMFLGASSFSSDLSSWDVSNVSRFQSMFSGAESFSSDLSSWDISQVTWPPFINRMLSNSGLTVEDYDSTLLGWSLNPSILLGVELEPNNLVYCDSTGRTALIEDFGWTIVGDSQDESCASDECHPDYDALMALFTSTNGDEWNDKTNWGQDCDPCGWYGVGCNNDGRVTNLDLESNSLSGVLSDLDFPNLLVLSVDNNSLSGGIPALDNVPELVGFSCSNNDLEGVLPIFDEVPYLRLFTCSNNNLSGTIPELNNVPSLNRFYANDNNLGGCIPAQLCNLLYSPDLSSLGYNVDNNPLLPWSGDLTAYCADQTIDQVGAVCDDSDYMTSDDIILDDGNCTCLGLSSEECPHPDYESLMTIYESTNGDNWTNSTGWGQDCEPCDWYGIECNVMNRVITIDLQTNNLTGTLPVLSFPYLERFFCNINYITGELPSLDNMPNLERFICFDNQFTGNFPPLNNVENLVWFSCFINNLSGSIPNLTNVPNIEVFQCSQNNLIGSIPPLDNVVALRVLSCHDNELTGSIPSLENVPNLETFHCSDNNLTGTIPQLDIVPLLKSFRCSVNNLEGEIPILDGVPNLERFYASDNNLSGCVTEQLCSLSYSNDNSAPGYNIDNNPRLPWSGDLSNYCIDLSMSQVGAACDDEDENSINDVILDDSDCTCQGQVIVVDEDNDGYNS